MLRATTKKHALHQESITALAPIILGCTNPIGKGDLGMGSAGGEESKCWEVKTDQGVPMMMKRSIDRDGTKTYEITICDDSGRVSDWQMIDTIRKLLDKGKICKYTDNSRFMAQDAKSKDWVQLYEIKDGLEISVVQRQRLDPAVRQHCWGKKHTCQ